MSFKTRRAKTETNKKPLQEGVKLTWSGIVIIRWIYQKLPDTGGAVKEEMVYVAFLK